MSKFKKCIIYSSKPQKFWNNSQNIFLCNFLQLQITYIFIFSFDKMTTTFKLKATFIRDVPYIHIFPSHLHLRVVV